MNALSVRQMVCYHDGCPPKLLRKLGAKPGNLRQVNIPRVGRSKRAVVTATDDSEVVHSLFSIIHGLIDRSCVGAFKSKVGPERCTEEAYAINDDATSIQDIDSQAPSPDEEILGHVLDVSTIELVISRYIHDGCRGERLSCPFNTANANVDVPGQHHDIRIVLGRVELLEFQVQI